MNTARLQIPCAHKYRASIIPPIRIQHAYKYKVELDARTKTLWGKLTYLFHKSRRAVRRKRAGLPPIARKKSAYVPVRNIIRCRPLSQGPTLWNSVDGYCADICTRSYTYHMPTNTTQLKVRTPTNTAHL